MYDTSHKSKLEKFFSIKSFSGDVCLYMHDLKIFIFIITVVKHLNMDVFYNFLISQGPRESESAEFSFDGGVNQLTGTNGVKSKKHNFVVRFS